jgi:muconate cycloisomerase
VAVIDELLSPALEGMDPCEVGEGVLRMERAIKLNPFTKAAVEMALWDIAGGVELDEDQIEKYRSR